MTCPRCAQPLPATAEFNFCIACGYDLRSTPMARSALPLPPPIVRLVACPHCGASNAASRTVCGRCRCGLDPRVPAPKAAPPPPPAPPIAPTEPESSRGFLFVTLAAGFVFGAVLLTLLAARGVGILSPLAGSSPVEYARLAVAEIIASSMLPPAGGVTYAPTNLVDGDPTTAWNEGARGAAGEWVEVTLPEAVSVARVLVWNGYQKGRQFLENGRVHTLLIDAGGRRFTVELLDVANSQAVDLPEPVLTSTIRLTIETIYEGDRYPDVALSELEVYGLPAAQMSSSRRLPPGRDGPSSNVKSVTVAPRRTGSPGCGSCAST